jgi:branched-chain amino acid transport system substrate-binding protein
MKKTFLGAVAAASLALAGILPAAAQDGDPIRVGSVVSATGPASFLGDPEKRTLEMYVEKINEAGGVLGRPLELVLFDDGGDAGQARTFATRLLEDEDIVAMVGGSTTGTTMAMVPLFNDYEVPFISLAGAVVIVDPVTPYVFKTPHTDKMACEKIFEDIRARGLTKVGLISGTDGFGKSMREQCLAVAPTYGMEIVADESYGPQDSDMTPQLTNIKNTAGLEVVVNPGFGQGPAIVTRNYAQLGFEVPLYQSHGVASKSFIDLAGEAAEGVRLPAAALLVADILPADDPQKKVVTDYKTAYEAATGQPVSTFGGHAYDGLMMLVAAIERAGSDDPSAIRDELEKTTGFIGTGGEVNMTPEDHMGLGLDAFRLLEIRNGDWTLVEE